jgi:hypothetical protein
MTLLLALSNERLSLLVADRRVTNNGLVKDEEFNKVVVLFCDDARVALAFTGLASCPGFNTQIWLREALYEIGLARHTIHEILQELENRATLAFSTPPISKLSTADRRLAILVTGFVYRDGPPSNIVYSLSNFDTPGTGFKLRVFPQRRQFVEVTGACRRCRSWIGPLLKNSYNPTQQVMPSNAKR